MRTASLLRAGTLLPLVLVAGTAVAQTVTTTTTGSVGCTAVTQAAVNGTRVRIAADDTDIKPPQSVTTLSCLNNFFNGTGLNLVTNLLNPTSLLNAVEGQICSAVQNMWSSALGSAQCGLTLTGFNLGFGGLGGGRSCPSLNFGGGGPPIATIGLGSGSGSGLYIPGSGVAPSGYSVNGLTPGTL